MDELEMPTDKAKVSAYIATDLKRRFDRLCEARDRSISNMVEIMIRTEVTRAEESGELPVDEEER